MNREIGWQCAVTWHYPFAPRRVFGRVVGVPLDCSAQDAERRAIAEARRVADRGACVAVHAASFIVADAPKKPVIWGREGNPEHPMPANDAQCLGVSSWYRPKDIIPTMGVGERFGVVLYRPAPGLLDRAVKALLRSADVAAAKTGKDFRLQTAVAPMERGGRMNVAAVFFKRVA